MHQPSSFSLPSDLSGRIALSIFCKTAFGVNTHMLRGDLACLEEKDVFIETVLELNEISAGYALSFGSDDG